MREGRKEEKGRKEGRGEGKKREGKRREGKEKIKPSQASRSNY